MLDSEKIPRWVARLADSIASSSYSEVVIVIVDGDRRRHPRDGERLSGWRNGGIGRRVRDELDTLYAKLVERFRSYPDAWRHVIKPKSLSQVTWVHKATGVANDREIVQ